MDFQSWIENVEGWASVYAFDILPDGSFSEIRLMAFNSQNVFMKSLPPEAPKFYPGIPYRTYFTDINFESFVYKCASTHDPLYSYVNTRGVWLKGLYLPITEPGTVSAEVAAQMMSDESKDKPKTVYCDLFAGGRVGQYVSALVGCLERGHGYQHKAARNAGLLSGHGFGSKGDKGVLRSGKVLSVHRQ